MLGNFMMSDYGMSAWGPFGAGFGGGLIWAPVMLLLVVWTVYWKYHAIWHAVKHDNKWWFLALLVINTVGILEILYLYVFAKKTSAHDDKNLPMIP